MKLRHNHKREPALKRLFHCLAPQRCLEVTGRRHLPANLPVVLVAGQEEGLDMDVLEDVISHPVHLIRGEGADQAHHGAVGYSAARPVHIGPRALSGWRAALEFLRRGESVVVSPMGCSHRERLAGAVGVLARRSGSPIVPVWCSNQGDGLQGSGLVVTFGPPTGPVEPRRRHDLADALQKWFRVLDSTAANRWPSPKARPYR